MKPLHLAATLFVFILAAPSQARADLMLSISGEAGGTTTVWEFSGSGSTSAAGTTGSNRAEWVSNFDFTDVQSTDYTATSGTVTISGTALASELTTNVVYIDNDGTQDDIGLRGAGVLNKAYGAGTIEWTGTLVVPVSIDALDESALPATFDDLTAVTGPNGSFAGVQLDLFIEFSAVPEPSSVAFLGLLGCGAVFRRRRRS